MLGHIASIISYSVYLSGGVKVWSTDMNTLASEVRMKFNTLQLSLNSIFLAPEKPPFPLSSEQQKPSELTRKFISARCSLCLKTSQSLWPKSLLSFICLLTDKLSVIIKLFVLPTSRDRRKFLGIVSYEFLKEWFLVNHVLGHVSHASIRPRPIRQIRNQLCQQGGSNQTYAL